MKNKGNYDKLISSISLLMDNLRNGGYSSTYTYSVFQNLNDIKKDLSLVIDPEVDSTYNKIGPIINKINCEIHQLKKNGIKTTSPKLTSLFNEAGPIISQCKTHLHFAEKKTTTKSSDFFNTSNSLINFKSNTKSKLERASYIAAIIGAIATVVGVILQG